MEKYSEKILVKYRKQIVSGMRAFARKMRYPDFDEKEYYLAYLSVVRKNPAKEKYFLESKRHINLLSGNLYEKVGNFYGRDAYLIGRAIKENHKADINKYGGIEIDGQMLIAPYAYPKLSDEANFEEDETPLPNISEDYYSD